MYLGDLMEKAESGQFFSPFLSITRFADNRQGSHGRNRFFKGDLNQVHFSD